MVPTTLISCTGPNSTKTNMPLSLCKVTHKRTNCWAHPISIKTHLKPRPKNFLYKKKKININTNKNDDINDYYDNTKRK